MKKVNEKDVELDKKLFQVMRYEIFKNCQLKIQES